MAVCTFDNWWLDFHKEHCLLDHYIDSVCHKHDTCHHCYPDWYVHCKPCCKVVVPEPVPVTVEIVETGVPFKAVIDAKLFAPHEIKAKTILNTIIVEAKHEEKTEGGGYTSREILRRYTLPDSNDIEKVSVTLGCDGNLTVTAPTKKIPHVCLRPGERLIPIKKL